MTTIVPKFHPPLIGPPESAVTVLTPDSPEYREFTSDQLQEIAEGLADQAEALEAMTETHPFSRNFVESMVKVLRETSEKFEAAAEERGELEIITVTLNGPPFASVDVTLGSYSSDSLTLAQARKLRDLLNALPI